MGDVHRQDAPLSYSCESFLVASLTLHGTIWTFPDSAVTCVCARARTHAHAITSPTPTTICRCPCRSCSHAYIERPSNFGSNSTYCTYELSEYRRSRSETITRSAFLMIVNFVLRSSEKDDRGKKNIERDLILSSRIINRF